MEDHPSLSLLIVVYESELSEFLFLLKSVEAFYDLSTLGGIYVAVQSNGTKLAEVIEKLVETQLPELSKIIRIVLQDNLIGTYISADGWVVQQLLKLKISSIVHTEYSLVLDSKNHFINKVSSADFFIDGKPLYNIISENIKFENGSSDLMSEWFMNSFELFDLDYVNYVDNVLEALTPFIMKKDISARLIEYVEGKYLRNFADLFINHLRVAEFYLYTAYLHSQGIFDKEVRHCNEWFSGMIWECDTNDEEYVNELISLIDSKQLKLFGIHKSSYGKISDSIMNKIFDLWDSKSLDYNIAGFTTKLLNKSHHNLDLDQLIRTPLWQQKNQKRIQPSGMEIKEKQLVNVDPLHKKTQVINVKTNKRLYIPIHIPKTGGSTIKVLVSETNQKLILNSKPPYRCNIIYYPFNRVLPSDGDNNIHISASKIRETLNEEKYCEHCSIFAVVRNPYSRVYSLWKYFKYYLKDSSVSEDFNVFIEEYCSGKYQNNTMFNSQLYFLNGDDDIQIFKLEEMDKLKQFLIEDCNVTWRYLKSNATLGPSYHEMYNKVSVNLIKNHLKEEFEVLNYSDNF